MILKDSDGNQYYKDLNIYQLIFNSSAEAHLHLVWYSAVNMQDLKSAMIKKGSSVLLNCSIKGYEFNVLNRPPEIWLLLTMAKLMTTSGEYKNTCIKHTASVLIKTLSYVAS